MKKISLMIFLFIVSFSLFSCKKKEYKMFKINEERFFIDEIYQYINNNKGYCLIDVRSLNEEYAKGHFRGFINYDIKKGNVDEFVYRITTMYSKDKAIFIIDQDGNDVIKLMEALKQAQYQKIYIYLGGYHNLLQANQDDFVVVEGTDDCGC